MPSPAKRRRWSVPDEPSSPQNQILWDKYLLVENKGNAFEEFDEEYDLAEQKIINREINNFLDVDDEIDDTEKNRNIMRMAVTFYSKETQEAYKSGNGWLNILKPLILANYTPSMIYTLFKAIQEKHVPNPENCDNIIRLLFLYHDTELAQFLVRKRVLFGTFSAPWALSLFGGICKNEVTVQFWKFLFRSKVPMIFYLVLAVVMQQRYKILSMKEDNKEEIYKVLSELPRYIATVNQALDICRQAEYLRAATPLSTESAFFPATFGSAENKRKIHDLLCLPVTVEELEIDGDRILPTYKDDKNFIEFCVVDCRPADEYNAGHLRNAINLDYTLHSQNATAFADKVDELLTMKPKINEDEMMTVNDLHFVFMGSGRPEDDSYLTILIDPILDSGLKYLSLLTGGYATIHDRYKNSGNNYLDSHFSQLCSLCNPNAAHSLKPEPSGPLNKLVEVIKARCKRKSTPKPKDIDCPKNLLDFRIVRVHEYTESPQMLNVFECHQILDDDREIPGLILLTENNIHTLRFVKNRKDIAYILGIRSLENLIRITQDVKRDDCINLKYGEYSPENPTELIIHEKFKFLVDNPLEVVKIIGRAVVSEMEMIKKLQIKTSEPGGSK